ncbi:MAG: methyltransferase family protein [Bacillota bacterium]
MIKTETSKKTWWTVLVFYFLIAFEIFYMVSPFAAYYYSIYGKGLNAFNSNPLTQWLSSFFLPHIVVDTASLFLDAHNIIGGILAAAGFIFFLAGAGHIYYYKFTGRGAVTGGIYNYIRHPQYLALSICGFGLLLVWPRYMVLIMFMAMLFAYYFLARAEEKECREKFGQTYIDYQKRTSMFVPFNLPLPGRLPSLPKSGFKRLISVLALYIFLTATAIGMANLLKSYSLDNMYTFFTADSATISVSKVEESTLKRIGELALSSGEVQNKIKNKPGADSKLLNYVLPADWYVPEIPMNEIGPGLGHHFPENYNKSLYKIIITRANLINSENAQGKDIILRATGRIPLIEVTVDLSQNKILKINDPPAKIRYENVPTPLF